MDIRYVAAAIGVSVAGVAAGFYLSCSSGCPSVNFAPAASPQRLIADRQTIQGNSPDKAAAMVDLRYHGWSLFQGVIAQSSACTEPVWRRWPDKPRTLKEQDVLESSQKARMHLTIASEATLSMTKADILEQFDAPTLTLEAVNYNPVAYQHIQRERLYDPAEAERLVKAGVREIKEFPTGTVIVKTFWRIVPAQGTLRLGLWDWSDIPVNDEDTPIPAPEEKWHRHVCVSQSPVPQTDVECPPVRADEFYSLKVDKPDEYSCFHCSGRAEVGDRLILIGMHVTTKEIPDWVWATYWWRGRDRKQGDDWHDDDAQRPPDLKGFWRNYSMDITLGLHNRGKSLAQRAVFNPYIEGAFISTHSNCLRCHDQARVGQPPTPDYDAALINFENYLRTDFLWSLASRLAPSSLRP